MNASAESPNEDRVVTDGFAFVEFTTNDPDSMGALFRRLGFTLIGRARHKQVFRYRQRDAEFILNAEPNRFLETHRASVRGIGIRVNDAAAATRAATRGGALLASEAECGAYAVDTPAIEGIGESLVYFVEGSLDEFFEPVAAEQGPAQHDGMILAVDHTSNIVHPQNLDRWADFYASSFGFVQKQYLDVKGQRTGMRARSMVAPCGKLSIPIAASAYDAEGALNQNDEFIRDYGGEGIQHIALLSADLVQTIDAFENAGIRFMDAPAHAYYEALDRRIPGHGLPVNDLERRGLLVDGKSGGRLLLQRFTQRQIGPVFFEVIERRGEDGFGEGNFKALFEAQEKDQARRGSLKATEAKAV